MSDEMEDNEDQISDTLRSTEELGISHRARAANTAIRLLDAKGFIEEHLQVICSKLEECDHYAQSADFNGDMMFIALSLPILNGVIHIASNRKALREATAWVVSEWKNGEEKDPDKVSILSALALIYVAAKGWDRYKDVPEKRDIWERIAQRVQKLSSEPVE